MTVDSEITKLKQNLINAYAAVESKEGTVPVNKNFDNLTSAIQTIVNGQEVEQEIALDIDEINGEVV